MGWANWGRKPVAGNRGPLGVDLNAGRARAAHGRAARNKPVLLDEPHADLCLAVMGSRRIEVGRASLATCRRFPHLVSTDYLPHLGKPAEKGAALPPDRAVSAALDHLQMACAGFDPVGLALPAYLTIPQVNQLTALATKAGLPVRGTASVPLALAAERATHFLHGQGPEPAGGSHPGVSLEPTTVIIVDADEYAVTAAVVRLAEEEVRVLNAGTFQRLGVRGWRERLLDAIADRCVRQCRRDPRDSAETEQMVFDQLESTIDQTRAGLRATVSVRSTHWYQDLMVDAANLAAFCGNLSRAVGDEVRRLADGVTDPEPPRAVWLTHDAGRLPGLAAAVHQSSPEGTTVRVLHPEAAAAAVANLLDRWTAGDLPATHQDVVIPLPPRTDPRLAPLRPSMSAGRASAAEGL